MMKHGLEPISADCEIHSPSSLGTYDLKLPRCHYSVIVIFIAFMCSLEMWSVGTGGSAKNVPVSTMVVAQDG